MSEPPWAGAPLAVIAAARARPGARGEGDVTSGLAGVHKGWIVYDAAGDKVGTIDEVNPTYLKLHKGLIFRKDIYVPAAAVLRLRGDEVHLSVRQGEMEALGWDSPPAADLGGPAGSWRTIRRLPPEAEIAPLLDRVFSQETLRIPIHAERVSVAKTPVITGEVALTKEEVVERQRVETEVRSTAVEVAEVATRRIAHVETTDRT